MSDYRPQIDLSVDIAKIGRVGSMIRRALQTFADKDGALADAVIEMNEIIGRLGNDAWIYLVNEMRHSPEKIDQALAALMVTLLMERVSVYAARVAEDVLFWTHGTQSGVRELSRIQKLSRHATLSGTTLDRRSHPNS